MGRSCTDILQATEQSLRETAEDALEFQVKYELGLAAVTMMKQHGVDQSSSEKPDRGDICEDTSPTSSVEPAIFTSHLKSIQDLKERNIRLEKLLEM